MSLNPLALPTRRTDFAEVRGQLKDQRVPSGEIVHASRWKEPFAINNVLFFVPGANRRDVGNLWSGKSFNLLRISKKRISRDPTVMKLVGRDRLGLHTKLRPRVPIF